jgi:cytidylate kinase
VGTKTNPTTHFIKEQVKKLERIRTKKDNEDPIPVITVSMEPGSGGSILAQKAAAMLGFDFFHREIIHEIAESGKLREEDLETIEKERLSGIQDFISSLISDHYLWPGIYLEHLTKVVEAIAKRGNALIVGRGANFILASKKHLSVRVVAPLETRVENVAMTLGVGFDTAKQRVIKRGSKRSDFVKKSLNEDVADPRNYDLVINTGRLSIDEAVNAVTLFYLSKFFSA